MKNIGNKITTKFVRENFEKDGYQLLSEYERANIKLEFICPKGHHGFMTWDTFKQGRRCYQCGHIRTHEKQKLSKEYVFGVFKQHGYEMLSEYVNSQTHIQYRCPNGHEHSMSWSNFNKGKRCPSCAIKRNADSRRRDINDIKQAFIKAGCTPLFDTYIKGTEKLPFICACGERWEVRYNDFARGYIRCKNCRYKKAAESRYQNGTVATSSQQIYLHNLLKGELNYPIGPLHLDIAFPDEMIYLEYDGSGHDMMVRKGEITREEFEDKEKRRAYVLYRRGWKCIRIISKNDRLPSDKQILSLVKEAKQNIIKGASFYEIDIDKKTIKTGNITYNVDFGELRYMRKTYRGND